MEKCKVSIIIPFYNSERFIKESITNVQSNSLKDIEIIYVDDGSTDNGGNIVKEEASHVNNIYYYYKENSGQGESRNLGLHNAKGKYVYFLDIDDYLIEDALELLYEIAEKESADIVSFNSIDILDKVHGSRSLKELNKDYIVGGRYCNSIYPDGHIYTGVEHLEKEVKKRSTLRIPIWLNLYNVNYLIKNKIVFPKYYHEDNNFSFDAFFYAKKIVYVNKIFHLRRVVENSNLRAPRNDRYLKGDITMMNHGIQFFDDNKDNFQIKTETLKNWNIFCSYHFLNDLLASNNELKKKYSFVYIKLLFSHLNIYGFKHVMATIIRMIYGYCKN